MKIGIGDLVEITIKKEAAFTEYNFIGFIDDVNIDDNRLYLETFKYGSMGDPNDNKIHFGFCDRIGAHFIDEIKIIKDLSIKKEYKIKNKNNSCRLKRIKNG